MAVVLIQNGAFSGAMAALLALRSRSSSTDPANAAYTGLAADAAAIAARVITANAALAVPMADADNAQIGQLVQAVTFAQVSARSAGSSVAADYAQVASQIAACAKAAVGSLI